MLATDIGPRFLQTLSYPNLEVRRHDIRNENLSKNQFDLAHVRLVLMHLAGPESALRRIIEALKPGGWITGEKFDSKGPDAEPIPRVRDRLHLLFDSMTELRAFSESISGFVTGRRNESPGYFQ